MRFYLLIVFCLIINNDVLGQEKKEPKISERLTKEYKSGSRHPTAQPEPIYTPNKDVHYESHYSKNQQYDENLGSKKPFRLPVTDQQNLLIEPVRRTDTTIECLKTHMKVTFEFSTPFSGYIYPHEHFPNCILFKGHQSTRSEIILAQGPCGSNLITSEDDPEFLPIIEHRLMIQWEKDFICEDDTSVIVRCDHPDSFNKTIEWNFTTLELSSEFERGQHPGPTMYMEIQRGEGPTAPVLSQRVYIGDVLTLVFTLSDDVFWFDSNMLSCTAVNGAGQVTHIDANAENPLLSYTGVLPVIEEGCSIKPKVFSHFFKEKIVQDGHLITLHYAIFKAFRFPTSNKILIQCDVQICYKECADLPACQTGFQPRQAKQRQRRSLDGPPEIVEPNKVELFKRTIEIWAPEDYSNIDMPYSTVQVATVDSLNQGSHEPEFCFSPFKFYMWIGVLCVGNISLIFIIIFIVRTRRSDQYGK